MPVMYKEYTSWRERYIRGLYSDCLETVSSLDLTKPKNARQHATHINIPLGLPSKIK